MSKKIANFLLILIYTAIIVCVALCIKIDNHSMYQSNKDKEINKYNEYLYIETGCSEEEANEIIELVGYLPPAFFNDFIKDNGKIVLVSELKGSCIGSTEIDSKEIRIYIKDGYVFDALIHEFGHVYLHYNPLEDEFTELYETEAKSLVNAYYGDAPYYYTDKVEYFAQAFQTVFVMGGNDTQDVAPNTFKYMSDLINEMY